MASKKRAYHPIYQQTNIGQSLCESLTELSDSGKIDPSLADKVKAHFDRVRRTHGRTMVTVFAT
jgi:hypothetical protein